ncbi:DEAD/DEAH box helicase [Niabella ginsenosidivorans]|uniref:DEAD-box ATP-dependent RNA helicase RhpA n=1 Tax=Niabella ginsenosidivorans TaxID=1176587 RepID=A0A1A9I975_9BACT|nr:DEAD/DEAH box helicase [Niabella ginsenosidivorans]ANH84123.1 DEAD/DEAH box helicase [Niabella ginsenosidivorans]
MSFNSLQLIAPLLKALSEAGYTLPTPVQEKSIPVILQKKDVLACAQTGTGKTASFALPLLQLLHQQEPEGFNSSCRALILVPTRELALQVADSFTVYGKYLSLKHLAIFGGVSQFNQVKALRQKVDVLIATPGRLLDLLHQRHLSLQQIKFLVLDEADRMLDMGFINDVKKILSKLPLQRQTILFSATMPPEIQQLADTLLKQPVKIAITPPATTVDRIQQSLYYTEKQHKPSLLLHLLKDEDIKTALVFARTKHGADKIAKNLTRAGIKAAAIHGNKSQSARQSSLLNFKTGTIRVLVATDIAARGIDIDQMGHVINYELPNIPETYVHRIGRTGRAGADGMAISFCDYEEKLYLRDIQKLIRKTIPVVKDHPFDVPLMHGNEQLPAQPAAWGSRQNGFKKRKGKVFLQTV